MATRKTTIQPGDSLRKIAQREYGDPNAYTRIKYNGPLQVGSTIDIPDVAPLVANPRDKAPLIANPRAPQAPAITPPPGGTMVAQPGLTPNPRDAQLVPKPVVAAAPGQPNAPVVTPGATVAPTQPGVTAPGTPEGVGAPNYGKPLAVGGQESFNLLSKLKSGVVSPDQTPVTPAEKEAFAMYNSYQKYKDYTADQLVGAIQAGELTPDPTNLLWRSLSENGKPTPAMVQAYALWDQKVKSGESGQAAAPDFLGGKFMGATSVEDLNAMLNADQRAKTEKPTTPTAPTAPAPGTAQYTEYETKILGMLGNTAGRPGGPEFEKSLNSLQTQYGVQADQNALNDVRAQIEELQAATRARQQANMDATVPMDVIAGRASEIERQDRERLDALARQENAIVNRVNSANSIIRQIMDAKQQDYGAAVDNYNQQFSQAMQTIGVMSDIEAAREKRQERMDDQAAAAAKAAADAAKEAQTAARANLQVYYNAVTGGNLDVATISPQQAYAVAQMEVQAGMPVGTFLDLRSNNPTKDIKSTSEYVDQNGQKHFDLVMVDRRTGKVSVETVSGGYDYSKMADIEYKQAQTAKQNADIAADYETTTAGGLGGVKPTISGRYGASYGAGVEANKSGRNQGVDLAVPVGTPVSIPEGTWKVVSAQSGVKGGDLKNYKNTPYGNSVMVENTQTGERLRLSHLSKVNVRNGDTLDGGTVIGASGATGNVSGPHLDLEYYNSNGKIGDVLATKYGGYYTGGTTKKTKPTAPKEPSATEKRAAEEKSAKALFSQKLTSRSGPDGKVSPDWYNTLRKNWVAQGGDVADFDKNFKQYVNMSHAADYGL